MQLNVDIPTKNVNYNIEIENDELSILKDKILNIVNSKNYIVVINKTVYKLYSDKLSFPKDRIFILNDGEKEKNFKNYEKIMNFAFSKNLTRADYIIAIGGGVVGDIVGFVASTYMRGINLIQIPTTLLSMTDSSVGGKVAVNTKFGKNLVGAFYQPSHVFINVNFLNTLDLKQFKSGLGEVIKYAFIEKSCIESCEPCLINFLSDNKDNILNKNPQILIDLIKKCLDLKISVVQQDEKESGLRKILNLGHTYGHVIETLTNYKKYLHGYCVIEGIKLAAKIAYYQKLIDKDYLFIINDLINKYEYKDLKMPNVEKILNVMQKDKKATNETISYILPTEFAQVKEYKYTKNELFNILININR